MSPWDVLKCLYDSEISAGLASDWDAGFNVWIGDDYNGRLAMETFPPGELDLIAPWLDATARRLFPNSDYAKTPNPKWPRYRLARAPAPPPS